jgi:retron-type reverse transcriptase
MQQRGYPIHLIQTIQSLYDETKVIIQSGDQITEEIETNQGVKQGCSLSPILFNIYTDDMIRRWKAEIKTGIKLNDRICLNTVLFADDQVIVQKSKSDLQMSVYKLHQLCSECNVKISLTKTKTVAFYGKQSVRTKIVIDSYTLE